MLGKEREVTSESLTPGFVGPDQVRSRSRHREERSRLTYDEILRLRREEWIWIGTRDGANLAPVRLKTTPPKPLKTYSRHKASRGRSGASRRRGRQTLPAAAPKDSGGSGTATAMRRLRGGRPR
jgi:hypothetical protein